MYIYKLTFTLLAIVIEDLLPMLVSDNANESLFCK